MSEAFEIRMIISPGPGECVVGVETMEPRLRISRRKDRAEIATCRGAKRLGWTISARESHSASFVVRGHA